MLGNLLHFKLKKNNNILKRYSFQHNEIDPVELELKTMITPSIEVKSWQRFSQAKATLELFR